MAWRVEIPAGARMALGKVDPQAARGILNFHDEKVARASDPTSSTASTAWPRCAC